MSIEKKKYLLGLHPKNWMRFLILTLPLLLLVAIVISSSKDKEMDARMGNISHEGEHDIEYQASLIHAEIKRIAQKLQFLSSHSHVLDILEKHDSTAKQSLIQDLTSFIMNMHTYDQVRLLDRQGNEVIRVDSQNGGIHLVPDHQLQNKGSHAYFRQAMQMQKGEVFISHLDLNIENGEIERPFKLTLRFSTPVLNSDGIIVGVLVFNYIANTFIDTFNKSGHSFGEKVIVDEGGHYLYLTDTQKIWGSILPERADFTLETDSPELWQQMHSNRSGQLLTSDGLFTFAMVSPYSVMAQQPAPEGMQHFFIISKVSIETISQRIASTDNHYTTMIIILLLYWIYIAILWLRSETIREKSFNELQQTVSEKRFLLQKQIHLQEKERRFLAHTLHDEIGQALTAIQAYAAFIIKSASRGMCESVISGSREISTVASSMQLAIRCQLNDLRPAHLDRLGLDTALSAMVEAFCKRENMTYTYQSSPNLPLLGEELNITLYRIVQESLTNIAKHANASHVTIKLNVKDTKLQLNISDNGIGMSEKSVSGLGLLGMRERVELLHGSFKLQSSPGKGVSIDINIPIEEE